MPLKGDDTDGHIDNLVRFCSDSTIAYTAPSHRYDPNNASLKELKKQIHTIKKNYNCDLEICPLPLPSPVFKSNFQLPANYTNFSITNDYVLTPVFNDKRDQESLKRLDELFPKHEIIDIDCSVLIQESGGIHCATLQLPQGLLGE